MKLFKKKEPQTFEDFKKQIQTPQLNKLDKLEGQRIKKELKKFPRRSRKQMLENYGRFKEDGKILMPMEDEDGKVSE